MALIGFGDNVFADINVQADADFDSDVNIDGNLVVGGNVSISGTITGVNQITDADDTTSISTDATAETLIFSTNSSEVMRIDSAGLVGIGTNNPTSVFQIQGNETANNHFVRIMNSGAATSGHNKLAFGYNATQGGGAVGDNYGVMSFVYDGDGNIENRVELGTGGTSILQLRKDLTSDILGRVNVKGFLGINQSNPTIDLAIGDEDTGLNQEAIDELAVYTGGVERMRFDSAGLVGIGTNDPSVLLEIAKDDDTNGQLLVRPASTTGADGIITIRGARNSNIADSNSKLIFENYDNDITTTSVMGRISGIVNNATTNIGDLAFYNYADGINGAESMRLTSGGLMGMGVPIPSYLIDLKRTGGALLKMTCDNTSSAGNMIINSTRTGVGNVGILSFQTNDNAISQVKGYLTDVANDYGDLRFFTKGSGGLVERMIIDEDGLVGIGGVVPTIDLAIADGNTGFDLAADGLLNMVCNGTPVIRSQNTTINFYNSQSTAATSGFNIRKNATSATTNIFSEYYRSATSTTNGTLEGTLQLNGSGNFTTTNPSDMRLKENIITYDRGINKIRAMRIVEYNWIDPSKASCGTIVGVIAQELQVVLPKAVNTFTIDGIDYLGISMTELIPFNTSAIKDVDSRVVELEAKVLTLETNNTALLDLISTMNDRITTLENV